jgi:hypothetical protein
MLRLGSEFMKFAIDMRSTGRFREILHGVLRPEQAKAAMQMGFRQMIRQGLAVVLSVLMIMVPMGQGTAFAQDAPNEGQSAPAMADGQQGPDNGQPAPQGQPLTPDQLDQLVAPMALYPDALVAQVLAASTYPTQVVEADRWRQSQGNAPPEQIAAGAESHNWDPSVKALTAFPTVLAQMDKNLQWTTDLGNAYYNQPQDVMDAVQAMRQKAQAAGQLRSTPQQTVTSDAGQIVIAPTNPAVVYVPVYNPWTVWGAPIAVFPGFYWAAPPGIFWGGLAIGFGVGIGIGVFSHWGWGWGHWGMGWGNHAVFFNRGVYYSRSTTVINRGFNRPGGPGRGFGARGAYARPGGGFNRAGGGFNRGGANFGRPGGAAAARPGGNYGRPGGGAAARPGGNYGRPGGAAAARPGGSYGRSNSAMNRGAEGRPSGASRASASSGRPSGGGGRPSGGGHQSGGGRSGGGEHKGK